MRSMHSFTLADQIPPLFLFTFISVGVTPFLSLSFTFQELLGQKS